MTVETYLLSVAPVVLVAWVSAMMVMTEYFDRRRDARLAARKAERRAFNS